MECMVWIVLNFIEQFIVSLLQQLLKFRIAVLTPFYPIKSLLGLMIFFFWGGYKYQYPPPVVTPLLPPPPPPLLLYVHWVR